MFREEIKCTLTSSVGEALRFLARVTVLFVGVNISTPSFGAEFSCRSDKHVVDSCFAVHGRLMRYANGRLNLWPVGSERLLGIQYPGDVPDVGGRDAELPGKLHSLIEQKKIVFGDFIVCPFTKSVPKSKQYGCIDDASNIVALNHDEWARLKDKAN